MVELVSVALGSSGVSVGHLAVSFVDAERFAELNEQWRDKPGPTDVLAFPMDELHDQRDDDDEQDAPPTLLGDVVLCPEVAQQQAVPAGHSTEAELHLLCTHGVLHLLGYDHADQIEEREMFSVQSRLLESWAAVRKS